MEAMKVYNSETRKQMCTQVFWIMRRPVMTEGGVIKNKTKKIKLQLVLFRQQKTKEQAEKQQTPTCQVIKSSSTKE